MSDKELDAIIAQCKSHWESNVETVLQEIESRRSITITRLVQVSSGDAQDFTYPALEILPDSTDVEYVYEDEPIDDVSFDVHAINYVFTFSGALLAPIHQDLLCYRAALRALVRADSNKASPWGIDRARIRVGRAEYWDTVASQESGAFLKAGRVLVTIKLPG